MPAGVRPGRGTRRPPVAATGAIGVLAAVGVGLGVLAVVLKAADATHPWWDLVLTTTSAALFLGTGVVAALRKPETAVGLLMMLTGVALYVEDVQLSSDPGVHTVGLLLRASSTALFAHLVLAFPTGVVVGRAARATVAAAYLLAFVAMPVTTVFEDTRVPNLLYLGEAPLIPDAVTQLGLPLAVVVFGLLVRRWVTTRPSLRYVLTPVLIVNLLGGLTAIGVGVFYGIEVGLYRPFVIGSQVAACLMPLAFLAGLFRARLGRSEVARLVESLSQPVPAEELRRLLCATLGDPHLVVAYRRADGTGLLSADGNPVVRPAPDSPTVVTDVVHDGRAVAALLHDRALLDDDHVLRAVTAAAGMALENQRLGAELRAQLVEVRESRARLVTVGQAERARIERDLHDGVQARLVAALIMLRRWPGEDHLVTSAACGVQDALTDLRRIAHGIQPAVLNEAGLVPAVRALLDGSGLSTTLVTEGVTEPDPARAETVYFVVAEALANSLKHGAAHRLDVSLRQHGDVLDIEVSDDGCGGARLAERGGLRGLHDRLLAFDGGLRISSPVGQGTRINGWLTWRAA